MNAPFHLFLLQKVFHAARLIAFNIFAHARKTKILFHY